MHGEGGTDVLMFHAEHDQTAEFINDMLHMALGAESASFDGRLVGWIVKRARDKARRTGQYKWLVQTISDVFVARDEDEPNFPQVDDIVRCH